MKPEYRLIRYKDIDQQSFGPDVQFYLGLLPRKSNYKVFGTNEKGIIILIPSYNGWETQFIYIKEVFRHQGVCKALITSALEYCKRYHRVLELKIIFNNPFADALEHFALQHSFILVSFQRIFILRREKMGEEAWEDWTNNRLLRVSERFESRGYQVASFNDAPKAILEKLNHYFTAKNDEGWETPRDMHPFHHHTDFDFSFVCWKDDQPISYICNERFGDSLISKEFFTFRKYFATGVSIIPLAHFVDSIRKHPEIGRVSFMILNENENSMRMFLRDYSRFDPSITIQKVYGGNAQLPK